MLDNKFLLVRGFLAVAGCTFVRAGDFGYFNADNNLIPFESVGVFNSLDAAKNQRILLGGVRTIIEIGLNKITVLDCKEF